MTTSDEEEEERFEEKKKPKHQKNKKSRISNSTTTFERRIRLLGNELTVFFRGSNNDKCKRLKQLAGLVDSLIGSSPAQCCFAG